MKTLLLAVLIGYAGVAGLVWLIQESLIFFRVPAAPRPAAPSGWSVDEVALTTRDGTVIAGVLAVPPTRPAPLVIYFGGNAEEVTAHAARAHEAYGDRAVLLVNYRGYGASQGKPGEKALVSDAVELLEWIAKRPEIDAARIALHGRSLGSGIAVQAAAAHPVKCVVLTSPFESALAVAKEVYPWLPVAWLLRHPFDSEAYAPNVKAPALFLIGEADTIIPRHHSERLAARWGGPVERASFPGFGHNDLDLDPRYARTIHAFLDRCL